jgi:hypothetical protein
VLGGTYLRAAVRAGHPEQGDVPLAAILDLGRTCVFARQAAEGSAAYYHLGESLSAPSRGESSYHLEGAQAWASLTLLKKSFDRYFIEHRVNDLERAIQFLTYFAALAMGHDLVPFSLGAVETLGHGLIGCMDERAADFRAINMPIIEEMLSRASLSFKRQ